MDLSTKIRQQCRPHFYLSPGDRPKGITLLQCHEHPKERATSIWFRTKYTDLCTYKLIETAYIHSLCCVF